MNFEIRMQELGESLIVSLLNRSKDTDQEFFVFFEIHKITDWFTSLRSVEVRADCPGASIPGISGSISSRHR